MSQAVAGAIAFPAEAPAEREEHRHASLQKARAREAWNPERFGREQIRGLVRQVFLSSAPARQVVFSPVDRFMDGGELCTRVAESLAAETESSVAILDQDAENDEMRDRDRGLRRLRDCGSRIRENIWRLPVLQAGISTVAVQSYLLEVRQEFAYSIVNAPSLAQSEEAMAMAQAADGIVLVISARRTRRVAAVRTKEIVQAARARLLGVVLGDREFPIPERIYRGL